MQGGHNKSNFLILHQQRIGHENDIQSYRNIAQFQSTHSQL